MSTKFLVYLTCDHLGCDVEIVGDSDKPVRARKEAHRRGWMVAKKKHGHLTDYCPAHSWMYAPVPH